MNAESPLNEERLAELLALLKAPPVGWIEAAAQLPRLRAVLDDIVARAEADAGLPAARTPALGGPPAGGGAEPSPRVVEELRKRFTD